MDQPMNNAHGAEVLRHEGPATKKLKKKKPMPPNHPPMSQGMQGMRDDDESDY